MGSSWGVSWGGLLGEVSWVGGGATKGPGRQNPEIDRSILGSLLGTATDFSIDFFPVLGVGNTSCCPSG